ncbi:hypothetical protein E4U09_005403, partial [Claviceps aff. purpurea]
MPPSVITITTSITLAVESRPHQNMFDELAQVFAKSPVRFQEISARGIRRAMVEHKAFCVVVTASDCQVTSHRDSQQY